MIVFKHWALFALIFFMSYGIASTVDLLTIRPVYVCIGMSVSALLYSVFDNFDNYKKKERKESEDEE